MSTDIIDARRPGLAGAAVSGLALLGRPGLLLGWALVAVPVFLLFILGARLGTGLRFWPAIILWPLFGIALRALQSVLSAAAYRARLRPEQGGPAYLKLGRAEWRVFAMGFGRSPGGLPMYVFVALAALMLILVLAIALTFAIAGQAAVYFGVPLAFLIWFGAVMIVSARSGLAGVAAFSGRADPQDAGWELGRGQTPALVGVGLVLTLLVLIAGGLLLGGWWGLSSVLAVPSALWSQDLPTDTSGWTRLGFEAGSLAVALGLLQVLLTAFGATAHAEIWDRLGGDREGARRRSLFEV